MLEGATVGGSGNGSTNSLVNEPAKCWQSIPLRNFLAPTASIEMLEQQRSCDHMHGLCMLNGRLLACLQSIMLTSNLPSSLEDHAVGYQLGL